MAAKQWLQSESESLVVLIVTGAALWKSNISDGTHIIHFALPYKMVRLSRRYASCLDAFEKHRNNAGNRPSSTFLVAPDDMNKIYENSMKAFLKKTMKRFYPLSNLSEAESVKTSSNDRFCLNWLTFGVCNATGKRPCHLQHEFAELERGRQRFSKRCIIKFEIRKVRTPLLYRVQILEYRKSSEYRWSPCRKDNLPQFRSAYQKHRKMYNSPKIGHFAVVMYKDQPERVTITQIKGDRCEVSFMDIQSKGVYKLQDLQYLMAEYREEPSDYLFIAGLVPGNGDKEWPSSLTKQVQDHLSPIRAENVYFEAEVRYHAKGLIFVDDVVKVSAMPQLLPQQRANRSVRKYLTISYAEENETAYDLIMRQHVAAGKYNSHNTYIKRLPIFWFSQFNELTFLNQFILLVWSSFSVSVVNIMNMLRLALSIAHWDKQVSQPKQ